MNGVAAILSTYHRPHELDRALASVLEQTVKPAEIVVVSDGCDVRNCELCANTAYLIAAFKQRTQIPLTHYQLPGAHRADTGAACRNYGLRVTSSPWIAYLDDDNWWEPTHLETLLNVANGSAAAFALSGIKIWAVSETDQFKDEVYLMDIRPRRPRHMQVDSSSFLHERRLIELYGPWGATGAVDQDWEIISRWLRAKEAWAVTGKLTLNYVTRKPLKFLACYAKNRMMQMFGLELHRCMK